MTLVTFLPHTRGENIIALFYALDLREHKFDNGNMCSDSYCFTLRVASERADQSNRSAGATSRDLVDALIEARLAVDALVRALNARQADSRPFLSDLLRNKAHKTFGCG